MNRLLHWLFGKQYRFEGDFYRPPWDENPEWKHLSGLFRWGGILNKPPEGKVRVGPYTVYLAPNVTAKDVRWDFLRMDGFDGYMDSERVFCPDVTRWINAFAPKHNPGDPEFKMFDKGG